MGNLRDWEKVDSEPLGHGGQSVVYLVRRPERTMAREKSFKTLQSLSGTGLQRSNSEAFAVATADIARKDYPSELAALKEFIPRAVGLEPEQSALNRLQNEINVLKTGQEGFLKLLAFNDAEKWIVTEYCSNGTLEGHLSEYRGKALDSLLALAPLVRTVAELHPKGIVHRDIKPVNIFVGNKRELLLGDFGIVFLPNQEERLTFTGESVGPRDFMPPWVFLGQQPPNISPAFDVYMLGKVLWCMVSGKLKLHREDFRESSLDVTRLFPDDPNMYAINTILDKCVVRYEQDCLQSAGELLLMFDAFTQIMRRGGQSLREGIPRPCRVCGQGEYVSEHLEDGKPNPLASLHLQRVVTGIGGPVGGIKVQAYTCNRCGNVQFFKSGDVRAF